MTLLIQLLAVVISTGSGDICKQKSIKAKSFGFITSNLAAEEINGSLDCSLQLTHLPQHALIEIYATSYSTPYPCMCPNKYGNPVKCNRMQINGLPSVHFYCLTNKTILYLYTSNRNSITFKPFYQNPTAGLKFNISYKG